MKTHTVFTLLDGSKFDDIKKAINHCDEMMGAELRTFLYDNQSNNSVYNMALKIVTHKAYDETFKTYLKWRQEHDELVAYSKNDE